MTPHIAIDPGASGGIAWRDRDGIAQADPMPEDMTGLCATLRGLALGLTVNGIPPHATIERVGGYMPGNSGPAACKFARHCGHIEAALHCLGIPFRQVAPQVWMKTIGALPKDKGDRKRAIREEMARRFPHLRVTLKTADALGIMCWSEDANK